jgi:predicted RNase H-like HicB family nuclease
MSQIDAIINRLKLAREENQIDSKMTNHKLTLTFEVDLELDNSEEAARRYRASVTRLIGCGVYASTETQALHKIRQALDIWLELANRQIQDEPETIQELIDMRMPEE